MKITKGFTLIEVLVVIGIIAILTVIVYPSINDIRKKNRDAERVGDISAIQLALSLYKNQNTAGEYPETLNDLRPKYVSEDTITPPATPNSITNPLYRYQYVPLAKTVGGKCTYYHLGVLLESPSAQIDKADTFDSTGGESSHVIKSGGYYWCKDYGGSTEMGLTAPTDTSYNYNVHP